MKQLLMRMTDAVERDRVRQLIEDAQAVLQEHDERAITIHLESWNKFDPPEIRLSGAARDAGQKHYSLTFEVSNQNSASVSYLGYTPESFDPPLEKGMFIYGLEFKRDGKWQRYPRGWCGFGMAPLELAPKSREIFGIAVIDDLAPNWEALKFGISWTTRGKKDSPTTFPEMTTAWSKEITRHEVDQLHSTAQEPPGPNGN